MDDGGRHFVDAERRWKVFVEDDCK
ncbi:uncharacterized protein G2W53_032955 [Senna tora]|uniref:Uncharacterized protein n=1 Tax=Senna tora TaxID=362788 RepID=A0A834T8P5_9FABA|nr:uncharacterized protein G2W53_032955 [Senna tora]